MKIAVPIAAWETGTTGEYVATAFRKLGHQTDILSQWQFYTEFKNDNYDLYFCVDSGGPLNLFEFDIANKSMKKLAFWMIDYRRGKDLKNPKDSDTVRLITQMGGTVFQAQFEDFYESALESKLDGISFLPLGADPDVWSNEPEADKVYDVAFVGNVWDNVRAELLETLKRRFGNRFAWFGHGAAQREAGAAVLRQAKMGFNVSSFYTTPVAFDVNMRVFETLSCGIPLITNSVPSLARFGLSDVPFVKTYHRVDDVVRTIENALVDEAFLNSGKAARAWILRNGTYEMRMKMALETLKAGGLKW